MASTARAPRAPLSDLPVAMFLYTNINTNTTPGPLPSPVSLPLKRGPPSAIVDPGLKRRPRVSLDEDELGTGKSPARRLFPAAETGPSSPTPPQAHDLEKDLASEREHEHAAASPISAPRRSARLASHTKTSAHAHAPKQQVTPSSSRSSSTTMAGTSASANHANHAYVVPILSGGHAVHDPGFTVFSDDDPRARPHKPTAQRIFAADEEVENVPPSTTTRVDLITAPNTGRRKHFERSKLGTQSVTAGNTSPPHGKEAMKLEAEGEPEEGGSSAAEGA